MHQCSGQLPRQSPSPTLATPRSPPHPRAVEIPRQGQDTFRQFALIHICVITVPLGLSFLEKNIHGASSKTQSQP